MFVFIGPLNNPVISKLLQINRNGIVFRNLLNCILLIIKCKSPNNFSAMPFKLFFAFAVAIYLFRFYLLNKKSGSFIGMEPLFL